MKMTSSQKAACAAHDCRRLATHRFFMPARTDAAGRKHKAYETYACEDHASHYKRYTTNYLWCAEGFTFMAAGAMVETWF